MANNEIKFTMDEVVVRLIAIDAKVNALVESMTELLEAISESEVSERIAAENTLDGINLEEELTAENTYGTLG